MANSAFAGVFTGPLGLGGRPLASFDTIMEENSFDKSSLQQDLLTSRFPATADDESSLGRQLASA